MKRKFSHICILWLLLTTAINLRAQYSIVAYEPPLSFTHLDLWHLTISGPVDSNMTDFQLRLYVFNDQNLLLLKSKSQDFDVTNSVTYINSTNLGSIAPLVTDYTLDNTYQQIANAGGYFPSGNYFVQFTLWGRPTDGEFDQLATYDYPISVDLLWPPMLISVENEDTICEPYPIFTWIPAYQQAGGPPISYSFHLAEVSPYQTAYQAMTTNPYHYGEENIAITMLSYPPYASSLVFGQQYAWQVDAVINGQIGASSEIWTFVYGCPSDSIVDSIPQLPYIKLRKEEDGGVAELTDKFLRISYEERYSQEENATLRYTITRVSGSTATLESQVELPLKEGTNLYTISVCGDGLDLEDGHYFLEVTDQAGIRWYVQFIKNEISCN